MDVHGMDRHVRSRAPVQAIVPTTAIRVKPARVRQFAQSRAIVDQGIYATTVSARSRAPVQAIVPTTAIRGKPACVRQRAQA